MTPPRFCVLNIPFLQQANPSDILLFHKRRSAETAKKGASKKSSLNIPTEPDDLDEINIEDLITDNLDKSDKKLELLDEKTMGEGKSYTLFAACMLFGILTHKSF